eukprot:12041557-Heterocapsa_arctica.AAC.1
MPFQRLRRPTSSSEQRWSARSSLGPEGRMACGGPAKLRPSLRLVRCQHWRSFSCVMRKIFLVPAESRSALMMSITSARRSRAPWLWTVLTLAPRVAWHNSIAMVLPS